MNRMSSGNYAYAPEGMSVSEAAIIWQALRTAISNIFHGKSSKLRFEELYRNAYNLVLHKHGSTLYNGVIQTITQQLQHTKNQILENMQHTQHANNSTTTSTTTTSTSSSSSATSSGSSIVDDTSSSSAASMSISMNRHNTDENNSILSWIVTAWET